MNTQIRSLVLVAVLTAVSPALAQDDDANAIDDTPHITIVGTAQADIVADIATITLGVTSEKPTAREASDETARVAQTVLAAARANGIGPSDIATRAVTLTETFDDLHDASGRFTGRKSRGFTASNMFAIKLRDLGKAGGVAQSLIEAGANQFDGIGFAVEHPEPILDRLAAEAVGNARRQAEGVAEAAGVKLGPVLLIERPTGRGSEPMPLFAARMKTTILSMPVEAGTTEIVNEMEVTWTIAR